MIKTVIALLSMVAMASAWYNPWWGGYNGGYYGGYYGGNYGGNQYWGGYYPGGYNNYNGYFPYGGGAGSYYGHPYAKLTFYGEFKGTCDGHQDGLYYVDDRSFAYCSNGKKTLQPCAEGSANPPLGHFKAGNTYGFYDFCAVNLVAQGYGAHGYGAAPAPAHPAPAYPKVPDYKPDAYNKAADAGYGHEEKYYEKHEYKTDNNYA